MKLFPAKCPERGNIAKTMTSNGKQFTVTREMLTAVARDRSVQLKMAWFYRRNPSAFFKICFRFVLLYNKSLNDWSLGKQWILFPSNLGKQNSLFASGPVTKCLLSANYPSLQPKGWIAKGAAQRDRLNARERRLWQPPNSHEWSRSTAAKPDVFDLGKGQTTTPGSSCPTVHE